jgi:hypothetical protein
MTPFVLYTNGGGGCQLASPGELVNVIADALGLAAATVTQYDRVLAEHGLRSKSGRGTSAAKITAIDAANLLIAILGSPISGASIKDAARICKLYRALPVRLWQKDFSRLGFPSLSKLPRQHCLLEGLSTLIAGAAKGEAIKIPGLRRHPSFDRFLWVRLDSPPWAEIGADGSGFSSANAYMARIVYHDFNQPRERSHDLHQQRSITFKTIRRLGELLREKDLKSARSPSSSRVPRGTE